MKIVEVDGLHKTLVNVKYHFEDIKGRDKFDVLQEVILKYKTRKFKTLVFCNTVDSCRLVFMQFFHANDVHEFVNLCIG